MNAPMGLETVASAGAGLNFRLQRALRARQIAQINRKLAEKKNGGGTATAGAVDVTGRERIALELHNRLAGKLADMRAAGIRDDAILGSWDVVGVVRKLKGTLKKLPAKKRPVKLAKTAPKVPLKAIAKRLSPPQKKAVIKKAIAKSPALRKKLAIAVINKRLAKRKAAAVSPGANTTLTPVPARDASPPPAPSPGTPSIPEESARSSAEAVEDEMMDSPLDRGAEEDVQAQEAVQEEAENTETDLAIQAAAEDAAADQAEHLTEPDPEEVEEEAAEDVQDTIDAATEGDFMRHLTGAALKARKAKKVAKGKAKLKAAVPVAKDVEIKSDGKIKATDTLKAAAIITAAKAGDTKSKAAITDVVKKANAGDPKAKKTRAQLNVANAVLNKSTPPKAGKPRASRGWYRQGMDLLPRWARR